MNHSGNVRPAATHARNQADQEFFHFFRFSLKQVIERRFDQLGDRRNTVEQLLPETFGLPKFRRMQIQHNLSAERNILQLDRRPCCWCSQPGILADGHGLVCVAGKELRFVSRFRRLRAEVFGPKLWRKQGDRTNGQQNSPADRQADVPTLDTFLV